MELGQNENFCASEDTVNKVKSQPIESEKVSANHTSGKGPGFRIKNS